MKKIIMLVLAAILFASAQDSTGYRFGVAMGVNFSKIFTSDESVSRIWPPTYKAGYTVGVIMEKQINRRTSFQFELLYREAGSKWGQPLFGLGYDGDYAIYKLRYISLPFYYKLKSNIGTLLKNFDFCIGLVYSYNIFAEKQFVEEFDPPPGEDGTYNPGPSNIRDEINLHEFGLTVGVKIPIGADWSVSVTYYRALNELYKDKTIIYPDDLNNKDTFVNSNFSVSVEYFIF